MVRVGPESCFLSVFVGKIQRHAWCKTLIIRVLLLTPAPRVRPRELILAFRVFFLPWRFEIIINIIISTINEFTVTDDTAVVGARA